MYLKLKVKFYCSIIDNQCNYEYTYIRLMYTLRLYTVSISNKPTLFCRDQNILTDYHEVERVWQMRCHFEMK